MKYSISRRNFVKASFGTISAISLGQPASAFVFLDKDKEFKEVARIESDELIVQVYENGSFSVAMKASGQQWQSDPWESIACRLILEDPSGKRNIIDFGSRKAVKIVKNQNTIDILFEGVSYPAAIKSTISLNKSIVGVALNDLTIPNDMRLVSIEYPFRSFYLRSHADEGYLALAEGEGCLIPTLKDPASKKIGTTSFWTWHDDSHSVRAYRPASVPLMPFYGAQKNGSGYTAVIETTDDFGFQYLMNYNFQHEFDSRGMQSPYERIVCAWPCWLAQKGKFGYQRKMRFEFKDGLDYVGMAKVYRKEAVVKSDHVSLYEKAKVRPQVDKMAGAPYLAYYAGYPHTSPGYVNYTYQQLIDVVNDLYAMGMERAFVHFWGAYTVQPPGCLPFDTQPGSVEKLKAVAAECKEKGFLFTLYNDISAQLEETDWWKPELMWKTEDGRVRRGMRWGRTCSSQYVDLLAKDMPEVVRTLGQEACYVDIINSGKMFECYDPVHPLTRTEDRKARLKFYQYVHSLGLIFGGEFAGWWNAAELEYTNGVGGRSRADLFNFFPVPLYQLVFHDALIPFCHAADDYSMNEGTSFEDKILRDLLRGIPPMFFINLWDHHKWRQKILDCYNVMSDTVKEVMYDEMLSHKWITNDQMVQQSEFISGVKITVNFDEIEREGLPAKGYHVSGSKNGTKSGQFKTNWVT